MTNKKDFRSHIIPLVVFTLLATLWLGDVLVLDQDLSAFDVTMRLPDWKADYEYEGVQQIILSDSPQAHYPERKLKWELIGQGHRINYNPYIFAGNEDFSLGVGSFVSSPFQLFMTVDEAIDWSTWFRLILAALFMYLLLLNMGMNRVASIFGGMLWAYNLHQMVWLEFPQHLGTQLWIPLLFYFNYSILKHGFNRIRVAGLLLINLLFYSSGYIQIVLYTYIAIGIFNTVYLALQPKRNSVSKFNTWLVIHLLFLVAVLVLLPKLLIDSEVIVEGLRGTQKSRAGLRPYTIELSTILDFGKNILPSIDDLKRFLFPDYFGGVWHGRYRGPGNIIAFSAFFSVTGILLLPFGVAGFLRYKQMALLIALLFPLLFAFGMLHGNPILKSLFTIIPMAGFGSYDRFITIALFVLVIISASGLNRLTFMSAKLTLLWLTFSTLTLVISCAYLLKVDEQQDFTKLIFPIIVVTSLFGSVVLKKFAGNYAAASFFVVVAMVELLLVTSSFNPRISDSRNFAATDTINRLTEDKGAFRVAVLSETPLYPPNTLQYYQLPTIGGYWTTVPVRYIRFVQAAYGNSHVTANGMLFLFHGNLETLRALNVKYVISDREIKGPLTPIDNMDNPSYLYELENSLERVYCASDLVQFENETKQLEELQNIFKAYDRPHSIASGVSGAKRLTSECSVTNMDVNINNISFEVEAGETTYVLIPYNYSRHWKARVNGEPIPVVLSNYSLLSVPVNQGTTIIELYFENDLNYYFVATQIALSLLVVIFILTSTVRSSASLFLILGAIIVIIINFFELPAVRNDDIPENPRALVEVKLSN